MHVPIPILLTMSIMQRIDLIKTGGFAAGENLVVSNVPEPEVASETEVVIDVKASAVNPVDWKMAEWGFYIPDTLPAALGCDVAGVVRKGPADMIGKRVVTNLGANKVPHPTSRGAYVQQVAQQADLVQELPDEVSFAAAASLPVGAFTAEMLLSELSIGGAGGWVLIWGASSSVGFNAVQLAKKRGWKPIAVASGKHENKLMGIGATAFVDYTLTDHDIEEKVKEIVGRDNKLNGATDCIGVADTFTLCCNLVKSLGEGTLAVSTVTPQGLPDPPQGVQKCPVNLGTVLENEEGRAFVKKYYPEIVKLQALPIRSVKGGFTAETVQEAFQICKNGVSGEKVVIEWTE